VGYKLTRFPQLPIVPIRARHVPNQVLLLCSNRAVACRSATARAGDPPSLNGGGVSIDLKTQLEKGLKARRPVEFEYIAEIVDLVEKEKLPRSLVTSTFGWARKKPVRQLQYFQFALQARAKGWT